MVEAAPSIFTRRSNKSTLDGVAMDVSDHLGPGRLAADIRVKIARLPELASIASELARGDLLERLEELRHQNRERLVDEQTYVLRHQDVGVNPRLMPPESAPERLRMFPWVPVRQEAEAVDSN
jgi:hypothetical protein